MMMDFFCKPPFFPVHLPSPPPFKTSYPVVLTDLTFYTPCPNPFGTIPFGPLLWFARTLGPLFKSTVLHIFWFNSLCQHIRALPKFHNSAVNSFDGGHLPLFFLSTCFPLPTTAGYLTPQVSSRLPSILLRNGCQTFCRSNCLPSFPPFLFFLEYLTNPSFCHQPRSCHLLGQNHRLFPSPHRGWVHHSVSLLGFPFYFNILFLLLPAQQNDSCLAFAQ